MIRGNRVFVDTSAFVAIYDNSDDRHLEAIQILQRIRDKRIKMFVTDYVLSETLTTAFARSGHDKAVVVGEFILNSRVVEFTWLERAVKLQAWDYFKRHADKDYSFTDCTSFVVMKEVGIKYFFAFDEHFAQAGFMDIAYIV